MGPEDEEGLTVWFVAYVWLCSIGAMSSGGVLPRSVALLLASLALPVPFFYVEAENALWRSILAFAFSFCECGQSLALEE